MTSRQTGKRISSVAAEQRRRNARRKGARQTGKNEPLPLGERRQLIRLVACGSIFVLLVAAKLALPAQMERFNEKLSAALSSNMDVQAVLSALGRGLSGDADSAAEEVYQAVFHPAEARETAAQAALPMPQETPAMDALREQREKALVSETTEEQALTEAQAGEQTSQSPTEVSTLAYVLYSDKNLPEDVSLEQAILDFDYCTPVSAPLSSTFGYREHPVEGEERFHYGVDLAADTGTAVACFADGTVTAVGESSSYGKYCMVRHSGGYDTLYAHCSRVTVSSGAAVSKGEKIAEVGETGMATGPHLHFELHRNGVYLNPIYYVSTS